MSFFKRLTEFPSLANYFFEQIKSRLMQSKTEKDIIPEPVEPGGVHPELGGQVDSQRESTVHGVVEESPAPREKSGRMFVLEVFLKMT